MGGVAHAQIVLLLCVQHITTSTQCDALCGTVAISDHMRLHAWVLFRYVGTTEAAARLLHSRTARSTLSMDACEQAAVCLSPAGKALACL